MAAASTRRPRTWPPRTSRSPSPSACWPPRARAHGRSAAAGSPARRRATSIDDAVDRPLDAPDLNGELPPPPPFDPFAPPPPPEAPLDPMAAPLPDAPPPPSAAPPNCRRLRPRRGRRSSPHSTHPPRCRLPRAAARRLGDAATSRHCSTRRLPDAAAARRGSRHRRLARRSLRRTGTSSHGPRRRSTSRGLGAARRALPLDPVLPPARRHGSRAPPASPHRPRRIRWPRSTRSTSPRPAFDAANQAMTGELPVLPADGIPHLASPDNLPPGSTMDPSARTQTAPTSATSRTCGTRSRPGHQRQGRADHGLAQRGMNTPYPEQAPRPERARSPRRSGRCGALPPPARLRTQRRSCRPA